MVMATGKAVYIRIMFGDHDQFLSSRESLKEGEIRQQKNLFSMLASLLLVALDLSAITDVAQQSAHLTFGGKQSAVKTALILHFNLS